MLLALTDAQSGGLMLVVGAIGAVIWQFVEDADNRKNEALREAERLQRKVKKARGGRQGEYYDEEEAFMLAAIARQERDHVPWRRVGGERMMGRMVDPADFDEPPDKYDDDEMPF